MNKINIYIYTLYMQYKVYREHTDPNALTSHQREAAPFYISRE